MWCEGVHSTYSVLNLKPPEIILRNMLTTRFCIKLRIQYFNGYFPIIQLFFIIGYLALCVS